MRTGPKPRPLADRFWAKVNKEGPVHPVLGTKCWVWTGATTPGGYGKLRVGSQSDGSRRVEVTSRASWEIHFGPIPEGTSVLHCCDVRLCVRPDHLFLGDQLDNVQDMISKGRHIHGARQHAARFSDSVVREILEMLGRGYSQNEVAAQYGTSQSHISQIHLGKIWAHVERP